MTAKEFVKSKYPKSTSERHVSGMIKGLQEPYYLIRLDRRDYYWFAQGKTESNAWVNAKKNILAREKRESDKELQERILKS